MNPPMRRIAVIVVFLSALVAAGTAAAEDWVPPLDTPVVETPKQPVSPVAPEAPAKGAEAQPASPASSAAPAPAEAPKEGTPAGDEEQGVISEPLPPLTWYDGTVTRVRDTDLIEINGEKMRLLGVTGPRRWWWGVSRDCHATESVGYLEGALKDKDVKYAFDSAVGPDNRRGLRRVYVMVDEHLVNADLIEKGHGFADRSRWYAMQPTFAELEGTAKLHMLGLWHTCPVECYRTPSVCRVKNW